MPRRWLWILCLAALLDLGGSVGYTLASREGLLSVVSVLAALYPVTTVALAMVVGRERIARVQLGGRRHRALRRRADRRRLGQSSCS